MFLDHQFHATARTVQFLVIDLGCGAYIRHDIPRIHAKARRLGPQDHPAGTTPGLRRIEKRRVLADLVSVALRCFFRLCQRDLGSFQENRIPGQPNEVEQPLRLQPVEHIGLFEMGVPPEQKLRFGPGFFQSLHYSFQHSHDLPNCGGLARSQDGRDPFSG